MLLSVTRSEVTVVRSEVHIFGVGVRSLKKKLTENEMERRDFAYYRIFYVVIWSLTSAYITCSCSLHLGG